MDANNVNDNDSGMGDSSFSSIEEGDNCDGSSGFCDGFMDTSIEKDKILFTEDIGYHIDTSGDRDEDEDYVQLILIDDKDQFQSYTICKDGPIPGAQIKSTTKVSDWIFEHFIQEDYDIPFFWIALDLLAARRREEEDIRNYFNFLDDVSCDSPTSSICLSRISSSLSNSSSCLSLDSCDAAYTPRQTSFFVKKNDFCLGVKTPPNQFCLEHISSSSVSSYDASNCTLEFESVPNQKVQFETKGKIHPYEASKPTSTCETYEDVLASIQYLDEQKGIRVPLGFQNITVGYCFRPISPLEPDGTDSESEIEEDGIVGLNEENNIDAELKKDGVSETPSEQQVFPASHENNKTPLVVSSEHQTETDKENSLPPCESENDFETTLGSGESGICINHGDSFIDSKAQAEDEDRSNVVVGDARCEEMETMPNQEENDLEGSAVTRSNSSDTNIHQTNVLLLTEKKETDDTRSGILTSNLSEEIEIFLRNEDTQQATGLLVKKQEAQEDTTSAASANKYKDESVVHVYGNRKAPVLLATMKREQEADLSAGLVICNAKMSREAPSDVGFTQVLSTINKGAEKESSRNLTESAKVATGRTSQSTTEKPKKNCPPNKYEIVDETSSEDVAQHQCMLITEDSFEERQADSSVSTVSQRLPQPPKSTKTSQQKRPLLRRRAVKPFKVQTQTSSPVFSKSVNADEHIKVFNDFAGYVRPDSPASDGGEGGEAKREHLHDDKKLWGNENTSSTSRPDRKRPKTGTAGCKKISDDAVNQSTVSKQLLHRCNKDRKNTNKSSANVESFEKEENNSTSGERKQIDASFYRLMQPKTGRGRDQDIKKLPKDKTISLPNGKLKLPSIVKKRATIQEENKPKTSPIIKQQVRIRDLAIDASHDNNLRKIVPPNTTKEQKHDKSKTYRLPKLTNKNRVMDFLQVQKVGKKKRSPCNTRNKDRMKRDDQGAAARAKMESTVNTAANECVEDSCTIKKNVSWSEKLRESFSPEPIRFLQNIPRRIKLPSIPPVMKNLKGIIKKARPTVHPSLEVTLPSIPVEKQKSNHLKDLRSQKVRDASPLMRGPVQSPDFIEKQDGAMQIHRTSEKVSVPMFELDSSDSSESECWVVDEVSNEDGQRNGRRLISLDATPQTRDLHRQWFQRPIKVSRKQNNRKEKVNKTDGHNGRRFVPRPLSKENITGARSRPFLG